MTDRRTGTSSQELLSSALRFHASSIFAESDEEADLYASDTPPDPPSLVRAIMGRVSEHAAANGVELGASGPSGAEGFAAVVTCALHSLHLSCHVAEALLAAHAAGGPELADALLELSPDEKEALLKWANAHMVLMHTFGPRAQLDALRGEHGYHFDALAANATIVGEHGMADEAYFTPLVSAARDGTRSREMARDRARLHEAYFTPLVSAAPPPRHAAPCRAMPRRATRATRATRRMHSPRCAYTML